MEIPLDASDLGGAAKTLGAASSERDEQCNASCALVNELFDAQIGWAGAAASAFRSRWDSVTSADKTAAEQLNAFSGILSTLGSQLDSVVPLVDEANRRASAHGWVLDEEGNVSLHGWSLLDPLKELDRYEIEILGHRAADEINGYLNAAAAHIEERIVPIHFSALAGESSKISRIKVSAEVLVAVAIKACASLQQLSSEQSGAVHNLNSMSSFCSAVASAEKCDAAITTALNLISSELGALESEYGELTSKLESAAGQYLNADQLRQNIALYTSGALAGALAPSALAASASTPFQLGVKSTALQEAKDPEPQSVYDASTGEALGGAWCASFVTWVLEKNGYSNPPAHADNVGSWLTAAQNHENGLSITTTPQPGDLVVYQYSGSPDGPWSPGHIGIVTAPVNPATREFGMTSGNFDDKVVTVTPPPGDAYTSLNGGVDNYNDPSERYIGPPIFIQVSSS